MTRDAEFRAMAERARAARRALTAAGAARRSEGLRAAAARLRATAGEVSEANAADVADAQGSGVDSAFLDRLRLDPERMKALAAGVEALASREDPVGRERRRWSRPSGVEIAEVSTPIGVIGVVFESRPNVAADAAALCVRSANAVILRGGSEAMRTTTAIVSAIRDGLTDAGLPPDAVQIPPDAGRDWVTAMLACATGGADLVIPRGGASLVAHVREHARVPVLSHLEGVCHVYIHSAADPAAAVRITLDSKMRRPGVCNAAETLLVDAACAEDLLPVLAAALRAAGCSIRGDERVCALLSDAAPASETDWATEYLDAVLAIRVVDDEDSALAHIARYGSGHTDAIVTEDLEAATRFVDTVDSAVVLHNASTGFSDGGEFGFGGEIGIATGRLHARGPVGADQLTTMKYVVRGAGQVRGKWPR